MDERGTIFGAATLAFGRGTSYGPRRFQGLDQPPLRTADVPRSGDIGSFGGLDYIDERSVVIDMQLKGTSKANYDSLYSALEQAMIPRQFDIILSLDNGNRVVFCRPRGLQGDREYSNLGQLGMHRLRFDARDSRIYDSAMQTIAMALPAATGGFVPPLIPPLSLSSASGGGTYTATNAGTYECRPVVVVTNCVAVNPRIENVTAGKTVRVNVTLASTDILVIDFDGRTIDLIANPPVGANFDTLKTAGLTNPASRRALLDPNSKWWTLAPGPNAVRFQADSYDVNAVASITWRSARLAV